MTKKEWIKAANAGLNEHANATFNVNNWLGLLECFMKHHEEVVFTTRRTGKKYTLTEILKTIQESMNKVITSHQDLAELSKGLIHSVPDDMEIKNKMSLFE